MSPSAHGKPLTIKRPSNPLINAADPLSEVCGGEEEGKMIAEGRESAF